MDMKRFIRKELLEQPGYRVDTRSCPFKIDAMESPFTIPPPLRAKLSDEMNKVHLNRYPERNQALLASEKSMRNIMVLMTI